MSQSNDSRDNFTLSIKEKNLAGSFVPPHRRSPPHEVLESGHLHHRGEFWFDLLPALMEDTGIVLGAAMTPEDAALE